MHIMYLLKLSLLTCCWACGEGAECSIYGDGETLATLNKMKYNIHNFF